MPGGRRRRSSRRARRATARASPARRTGGRSPSRDHRRDAEREIDERDEHALAGVAGKRVTDQAAARPNSAFSGTATGDEERQLHGRERVGVPRAPSTGARPAQRLAEDRRGVGTSTKPAMNERDGHEGPTTGGRSSAAAADGGGAAGRARRLRGRGRWRALRAARSGVRTVSSSARRGRSCSPTRAGSRPGAG